MGSGPEVTDTPESRLARAETEAKRLRRRNWWLHRWLVMSRAILGFIVVVLVAAVAGAVLNERFSPVADQIATLNGNLTTLWDDYYAPTEPEAPPPAELKEPVVSEADPHGEQIAQLSQELQQVTREKDDLKERVTALERADPPEIPPDRSAEVAALTESVKALEGQPKVDPETLVTLDNFNQRFAAVDEAVENLQTQIQVVNESNLRRDEKDEEMKKSIAALGVLFLMTMPAQASAGDDQPEGVDTTLQQIAKICPDVIGDIKVSDLEGKTEVELNNLLGACQVLAENRDLFSNDPSPESIPEVGNEEVELADAYGTSDRHRGPKGKGKQRDCSHWPGFEWNAATNSCDQTFDRASGDPRVLEEFDRPDANDCPPGETRILKVPLEKGGTRAIRVKCRLGSEVN